MRRAATAHHSGAPRAANHGFQPVVQHRHITVEHGLIERRLKPVLARRHVPIQPHQQVIAQRSAEQPWHLRCLGDPWRHHERCQVIEPLVLVVAEERAPTEAYAALVERAVT